MIDTHAKHAAQAQTFADKRSWNDFRIGINLSAKSYNECGKARQVHFLLSEGSA